MISENFDVYQSSNNNSNILFLTCLKNVSPCSEQSSSYKYDFFILITFLLLNSVYLDMGLALLFIVLNFSKYVIKLGNKLINKKKKKNIV